MEKFNFGPKTLRIKLLESLQIKLKNWKNIKWKIIIQPKSKFESKLLNLI